MKHTNGPWSFVGSGMVVDKNNYGIAKVLLVTDHNSDDVGVTTSETVRITNANAHLIAAAPELLEACEHAYRMLTVHLNTNGAIYVLREAIAKAEGEEND